MFARKLVPCYYGDMAEQLKSNRVEFPLGKQKEFIIKSKNELDLTWQELAKIAKTSSRNLNDWKNEKISMSLYAVEIICKERKCQIPKDIILKEQYWYAEKGAKAGGEATYRKYGTIGGDQEKRKVKWRKWWDTEGKFKSSSISNPLPFKKPKFSEKLAEFVGIMLGDGGITRNQIRVTLHSIDDLEYSCFVEKLIENLFDVRPSKKCRNNCRALNITISRVELVKFLTDNIGLCVGNKIEHQVDVPDWIKNNAKYAIACLRGLVDTDGSVYSHVYKSKCKVYSYKKVQFTSMSKPLANSVYAILRSVGFNPGIHKDKDVRLENNIDVKKYFEIVGTHNKKHLERYIR